MNVKLQHEGGSTKTVMVCHTTAEHYVVYWPLAGTYWLDRETGQLMTPDLIPLPWWRVGQLPSRD